MFQSELPDTRNKFCKYLLGFCIVSYLQLINPYLSRAGFWHVWNKTKPNFIRGGIEQLTWNTSANSSLDEFISSGTEST